MKLRAAAKGRKLLFLAAVCLLSALLLSPTAEASRGLPVNSVNLEPPVPRWDAEAPPAPALDVFHIEDELLLEILTGVEPENHKALLEHRRLELLSLSSADAAIQKTASGVSTSGFELNVQKGKLLEPDLRWTVPFYAKARFYDPEVGRFLTEDPAEPDLTIPPSLHRYLYAYGNPTRYWDPFGLAPEDPDEEEPLNVLFDKIADSPVGRAVGKATGAVGELADGAGALAGQATEKALRGDTPEDPSVREIQQELGLNPDRPQLGLQPGRTVNRQFAQDAGEIVERGTATAVEEIVYAAAGAGVGKTGKLVGSTSSTRRRVRTGGGYVEVSDNVADGAPLSGGFGRRRNSPQAQTRVIVESSNEAGSGSKALVDSASVNRTPSVSTKKSYRPGDVLPGGRIAGQGPGAAHISDPGFSLDLESPKSPVVSRAMGQIWRYPEVTDLRTKRSIRFPAGDLSKVPLDNRVSWGANDRAAFIAEWHQRGYSRPLGGWNKYDIHHIHPRELGGTNEFWNLSPVERGTHQELFNAYWREFVE